MSYRRDRRSSTRRPSGRAIARRPSTTYRERSFRSSSYPRQRPRGPQLLIILLALVATGLLLTGVFLSVQVFDPSDPRPTSLPVVSPSVTLLAGVAGIPTAQSHTVAPAPSSTFLSMETPAPPFLNLPRLQNLMVSLINQDRAAAGLESVSWDETAGLAAQLHSEEMASYGYTSHWNLDGYGPPFRYSQAGGLDAAQENVYMYWHRYEDGQPVPISNWEAVVRQAQSSLMESSGHRANILAPEHTHVGIGIAYNPNTGDVRLAQLFVNRYVQLMSLPKRAKLGQQVTLQGRVRAGGDSPLLNLAYEPFPEAMSIAELNSTSFFASKAEIYDAAELQVRPDGYFEHSLVLDNEQLPGLYYINIWVDSQHGEVLANEVVVEVR